MLILRIRRAEVALADGRLDEAYDQTIREDVRQHRKGQRLADRLAKRLIERGQLHAAQGQFTQALFDYERAARLGGNQADLVKLRDEASRSLRAVQDEQRRHEHLVSAARRQIQVGELSVGAKVVDQLGETGTASAELVEEIALKRASTDAVLQRAEAAWQRQDYTATVEALQEVKRTQPRNQRAAELTQQVTRELVSQTKDAVNAGRLEQASLVLQQITPLSSDHWEVIELMRALHQCREAASRMQNGNLQQAHHNLSRLAQSLPDADWVQQAMKNTDEAIAAVSRVLSGPLGLIDSNPTSMSNTQPFKEQVAARAHRRQAFAAGSPSDTVPDRFLMQVDGAGSYIVSRTTSTAIGPASSSRPTDIALLAPSHLPTIRIERLDGDYFLRSSQPVRVNKREVTDKLLSDGDQVVLGPRCSFRFLLPNAASTTAVLDLTGARLARQDVRRVVLLDQSLVLGSNRTAHIVVHEHTPNIVLHLRDRQLCYRESNNFRVHAASVRSVIIPWERPVQVADLNLVVTGLNERPVV